MRTDRNEKDYREDSKKRILPIIGAAIICLLAGLWVVQPSCADAAQTDEETVLVGYYENEVFQEVHSALPIGH